MSKAVLLDRDGTINVDHGYLHDPALLELLPGVEEALTKLTELGYLLILITNQSGIGRGYFTEDKYLEFNQALISALEQRGIKIAATYMCPHAPEEDCTCRKPNPYMALRAIEDFGIEAAKSYMFGDKTSDVECGEAAGLTSRLIKGEQDLLCWTNEIIDKRL
ncbi:MAG: HAD family hydrolase [Rikenellaceae bacterium]